MKNDLYRYCMHINRAMRPIASGFSFINVVIIVIILYVSFTGYSLTLNAEKSGAGYYDTAAVATDAKECSKIGTCVEKQKQQLQ